MLLLLLLFCRVNVFELDFGRWRFCDEEDKDVADRVIEDKGRDTSVL